MRRFLSILALILTILFVIFIIQNAEMVGFTFLAWSIMISKALLMILCAAVGFLLALVLFWGGGQTPRVSPGAKKPGETQAKPPGSGKTGSPGSHQPF